MMDLTQILASEVQNTSRIVFYEDGGEFRAYNRSGWFAIQQFGLEAVEVHSIWLQSDRMVYVAFSSEELEGILADVRGVDRFNHRVTVPVCVNFDVTAYYKWREPPRQNTAVPQYLSPKDKLWEEVRRFPGRSASDEELKQFVERIMGIVEKGSFSSGS